MKLRNKLTLQFSAIVGLIFIVFSLSIFYSSKIYRYRAFNNRLLEKALNTATLLIEVDEIDIDLLKNLRRNYLQALPNEFVRVYDEDNQLVLGDDTADYHFSDDLLNEVRQTGELDYHIGERQFVAIKYKNDFVIVASAINLYGNKELQNLAYILIVGNLLGIVVIFVSGKFFAKQALLPISEMITRSGYFGREQSEWQAQRR